MKEKINREWVKTFAIIFLAIMLVLTFFSNTIMNMSLPEVSTDHIQYGQIKTQVRGTGSVVSLDSFSVTTPLSREITAVHVRSGDRVEIGDVLFSLKPGESKELDDARNKYDELKYQYEKLLINSSASGDFAVQNRKIAELEEDIAKAKEKLANIESINALIEAKQQEVNETEKLIRDINRNIEGIRKEISALEAEKSAIGYTPTEYEALTGRQEGVTYEQYVSATEQIDQLSQKIYDADKALAEAQNVLKQRQRELSNLESDRAKLPSAAEIESIENQIKQSDRSIEDMERELKYVKQEFYDKTTNSTLERLYSKYEDKKKAYKKAKSEYEALISSGTASEGEIKDAEEKYKASQEAVDDAYEKYENELTKENDEASAEEKVLAEHENKIKYAMEDNLELKEKYSKMKEDILKAATIDDDIEKKKNEVESAQQAVNVAETVKENAENAKSSLEKSLEKIRNGYKFTKVAEYEDKIYSKEQELDIHNDSLEQAKNVLDEKNDELEDLREDSGGGENAIIDQIRELERQLITAQNALTDSMIQSSNNDKLNALEIQKLKKEVDKAQEELTELEEKAVQTDIMATVAGVIESVNYTTGQTTRPDEALATISVAGKGLMMTMTATVEQASKLRPGDIAEITGYVPYGTEVKVVLKSIKNDTQNPQSRQKILEFSIDGDIAPGRNLSIAVGNKNASYDSTVPNTAIREDSNGKYILVVDSKSTAISTRYVARRVNVTVLASDDIRSAISGDFDNYAYVVATSSKPINDGEQVKLIED